MVFQATIRLVSRLCPRDVLVFLTHHRRACSRFHEALSVVRPSLAQIDQIVVDTACGIRRFALARWPVIRWMDWRRRLADAWRLLVLMIVCCGHTGATTGQSLRSLAQ